MGLWMRRRVGGVRRDGVVALAYEAGLDRARRTSFGDARVDGASVGGDVRLKAAFTKRNDDEPYAVTVKAADGSWRFVWPFWTSVERVRFRGQRGEDGAGREFEAIIR
ncbi:MAG: hypothetical protein ACLT4Y_09635 [Bifidobacterium breve]